MNKTDKHFYEFGPFRLDATNRLLFRDGELVPIKKKAFDILFLLVERHGQVLSKEEVMETIWPETFVEESNLSRHVYLIRRALEEGSDEAPYITTIPGRGYRFTARVNEEGEEEEKVVVENHTFSRVVITEEEEGHQRAAEVDQLSPVSTRGIPALDGTARSGDLALVVKRHKLGATMMLGALLLATVGGVFLYLWIKPRPSAASLPAPRVRPFTSLPGTESEPAFSPDGKQIAFAWDGGEGGNSDIYVQMIDAGLPLRLTTNPADDGHPAWSPDGRFLAFLRGSDARKEVWIVPALGGPERKVGEVISGLDWSPDGKYLVVTDASTPEESAGLFLLSVEIGEKRRLTSPPAQSMPDMVPAFSPDGHTIAFIRVVSSGVYEIHLVPSAGGAVRRLTFDNRRIESLAWSADGREIIFTSDRGGALNLWRVRVSGGAPERIVAVGGEAYWVAVARQGFHLAYANRYSDTNIWRLELTGERGSGKLTRLIASSRQEDSPQFSPDGQQIAFVSNRSGSWEIWVCDQDGNNPAQVTSFGGTPAGSPRWSPDGRWIAFDARPAGNSDIFVVSAFGGQPRRLTTDPASDGVPSWSRDGHWIYFVSNRSGERQLWKLPAAGGPAVQITKQGGFEAVESPDGKFLYYAKRHEDGIFRVPVEGGEEILVPELGRAGYYRYWAMTEAGIFFVPREAETHPVLNFFDFARRQVRPVATLAKRPLTGPSGLAVSPDGRWILYTQEDQLASDIMLVDNFR